MLNSIISQDQDEREFLNAISSFFSSFSIGRLLHKCNAQKEKGVPVVDIFKYKLCNVFSGCSMYMQQKTGSFKESFSKNTYYRFLNSPKTNWLRFTTLLSKRVADVVEPLTSDDRVNAFVVDDSLFERTSCKKTELGARVFDHTTMKYRKGYRLMTLGWTDGNTFLPINSCLLASSKDRNLIGPVDQYDGRSLAAKRRKPAQTKGTEVMIELLKTAQKAGHHADYVLFDTWFSSPKTICQIKEECGLDTIAMIKKSSRIKYLWEGQKLDVKEIYSRNKKRRGRSRYLLSVMVDIVSKNDDGDEVTVPAKIVYVRNTKKKKDWIAIICTDAGLSENEVIRIYGKRWQTEVFYKTCKSWLHLGKECQSLSYDSMTAHVSIVFARYMLLSVEQRKDGDERSICELFYVLCDELADITYNESLQLIVNAMLESLREIFHFTDEQTEAFTADFVSRLPEYLQSSLGYTMKTA